MSDPFEPTGSNFEAHFQQEVHKQTFGPRGKLRNTSTISFDKRHNGIFPRIKRTFGGSSGLLGPFQIDSVQGDYLIAYAYDPENSVRTGTVPVYIALEDKHQQSLEGETIFGIAHVYTYTSGLTPPNNLDPADSNNVFRTDTYSGTSEVQRIYPPWVCGADGELVWAMQATTGVIVPGGNSFPVTLQIAGRSSQWGAVPQ